MASNEDLNCDYDRLIASRGVWLGENPLDFTLPLLALELVVVTVTCRAMAYLFKPLMLPRVCSDVVDLFPKRQEVILTVLGDIALIFWFFLMGIQLNLHTLLKRIDKKAMAMAVVNNVSTIALAFGFSFLINRIVPNGMKCNVPPLGIGLYLGMPTLTVLAGTLVQHKVLQARFARLALNSAFSSQLILIVVFNFVLSPRVPGKPLVQLWVGLCGLATMVFMYALSRLLLWPIRNEVKEYYVCMVLLGVVFFSLVTEVIGLHITTGAFISGIFMPNGLLAASFNDKLEDLVALLLPLVLALTGQRIDVASMFKRSSDWTVVLILASTYVGKVLMAALAARLLKFTLKEGCLTGMLLSSKGIVDAVILIWTTNTSDWRPCDTFAIMIIGIVAINLITSSTIRFVYKAPPHASDHASCRAVQQLRADSPFCILVCIHDYQLVPTLISLLERTNGSQKCPINVCTLHLIHATGRESNLLYSETVCNTVDADEGIVHAAFKNHHWINENVIVEHYERMSPYSSMHEDVVNLAVDKSVALIIIPFHKEILETAESSSKVLRLVNQHILANAPCSVAILVQRGLVQICTNAFHNVAVLFFGGPDDREALAYATRMAKQEGVSLSVVRFLSVDVAHTNQTDNNFDREKVVDDYCIGLFQMEVAGSQSVSYNELFVTSGAETVDAILSIKDNHDLFMVGMHQEKSSSLMMSGMEEWNEYEELGPMGDFLTSTDFAAVAVLVFQQHVWRKDLFEKASSSQEDKRPSYSSMRQEFSQARQTPKETADHSDRDWTWQLRSGF